MKTHSIVIGISALLLAIGIASAGMFVSLTLRNSQVNTAEVKGLAERKVVANKAYWNISYTVSGDSKADLPDMYARSEADYQRIVKLLKENGFDEGEIVPGIVDYRHHQHRNDNQELIEEEHYLVGYVGVRTGQIPLVPKVRIQLNKLIAEGLDISNNSPMYYFTGLNKIKPEMLKEATMNARIAANEFAANAGVKVGGIRSARQGGFVIRDEGEDYGDTAKIRKDVRVVTNITFFLTE